MRNLSLLALSMSIAGTVCTDASAATIVRNYQIDILKSNLYENGDSYYLGVNNPKRDFTQINEGDILTGNVTFNNGALVDLNGQMSLWAYFRFDYQSEWYRPYFETGSFTSILDENGSASRSYRVGEGDRDYALHVYGNAENYYNDFVDRKTSGFRYMIIFHRLIPDSYGPVYINFGGLSLYGVTRIASAVPEPSTWAMMMLGMAGVGLAMRRRRAPASVAHA